MDLAPIVEAIRRKDAHELNVEIVKLRKSRREENVEATKNAAEALVFMVACVVVLTSGFALLGLVLGLIAVLSGALSSMKFRTSSMYSSLIEDLKIVSLHLRIMENPYTGDPRWN